MSRLETRHLETLEGRTLLSAVIEQDNTAVRIETNVGAIVLELLVDEAPQTVAQFLDYVADGSYVDSVFHRSAKYSDGGDFVIQGGGYIFNETSGFFDLLDNDGNIPNEPGVSNLERTVAMAKLGGDPDSATRQFFFNLSDRNATDLSGARLDTQNEGFTVFARVVEGWEVVMAMADLDTFNGGGAFTDLPVTPGFDPLNPGDNPDTFVTITGASVIYRAGDRPHTVMPGAEVIGDSDSQSRSTLVSGVTSGADRIEVFQLDPTTGVWSQQDLLEATGRTDFDGSLDTFADPSTGRTSVVAAGGDGVVVFSTVDGVNWFATDITAVIAGAEPIASDVTTFTSNGGVVYVAGFTAGGEYVLYSFERGAWGYENVSRTDFAVSGSSLPTFEGELVSYVTSWGGLNVAGLDSSGDIWAAWTGSERGQWNTSNLSAITGAPAYQGTLTVFLTTWGAINLAGATSTGDIVATWWLPSFGADWRQANLTDAAGGPALSADSISSYVTPWGGLNVAGLDASGNVIGLWWAPGVTGWNTANLSSIVPDLDRPIGAIRGFTTPAGIISLVGADGEGDVVRYAFDPSTLEWTGVDVSDVTGIVVG